MHERPANFTDAQLKASLEQHWGLAIAEVSYAPVGFGGYHWNCTDLDGNRWFATLSTVPDAAAFAQLDAAMSTAAALAARPGLEFVVGPVPMSDGVVTCQVSATHAITVFPFIDGKPGSWGDPMTTADRAALTDMIAALHMATPPPSIAPARTPGLPGRAVLDRSLRERGRPWLGGPYAEPARAILSEHGDALIQALAAFDALAEEVVSEGGCLVITHGEPHTGNLVRVGADYALIDWDTVGFAWPERDLWWIVTDSGAEAAMYAERTGRTISAAAIALYTLRWDLDDVACFVADFRAPHLESKDTEVAFAGYRDALERFTAGSWR